MVMPQKKEPEHDLYTLTRDILASARSMGANEAEVDVGTGTGFSVTVRLGEIEKIEHERDKSLNLTVYMGKHKGSASTSDFSKRAVAETVSAACTIASHASEDPFTGLVEKKFMTGNVPDLDLFHPWELTPEQAVEMALECENAARAADSHITNSDGAVVSTYSGEHVYGNTNEFTGGWKWSSHMIDCTVIAGSENRMQRDGWYSKCRDYRDLESLESIAREATRRTVSKLGARQISTRSVPVLFEAPVASGLFSAFITAVSGSSLYRRASFLLDKLDQKIFPEHIHIHEEPHLKKALGSAPFDNDGVATKPRDIVVEGILRGYFLSAYSARKLGMETTANAGGVHNLVIEPGKQCLAEMIKTMHKGLLITDMIGFGVNQVTGDYSRGASGFWVEQGEIAYPVEEVTVAGNLADMYRNIALTGNDVDPRGNILTGSVLVEGMTVAGE